MEKSLICIMSFLLLFSIVGCAKQEKFVGSKHTAGFNIDMEIYQSVDAIKAQSVAIVIASYSEDPVDFYEEEWDLHSTRYSLNIEKVLKGNLQEDSMVIFSQLGKPNDDTYETKIKRGQKYLLFLAQKDLSSTKGEIVYDAVGMEQGILEIHSNDTLYCYFDIGIMPEYNGEKLSKLEAEINKL